MQDEKQNAELADALLLPGYLYTVLLDGACLILESFSCGDGGPAFEAGAVYPWPAVRRQLLARGYRIV
jgi:hypothetical protein